MDEKPPQTDPLEAFFDAARAETQTAPAALTARIAAQGRALAPPPQPDPTPSRRGLRPWRQIVDALGGWPALAGLATACAAGVWIGLAPPSNWPDPAAAVFPTQSQIDWLDLEPLELSAVIEES